MFWFRFWILIWLDLCLNYLLIWFCFVGLWFWFWMILEFRFLCFSLSLNHISIKIWFWLFQFLCDSFVWSSLALNTVTNKIRTLVRLIWILNEIWLLNSNRMKVLCSSLRLIGLVFRHFSLICVWIFCIHFFSLSRDLISY